MFSTFFISIWSLFTENNLCRFITYFLLKNKKKIKNFQKIFLEYSNTNYLDMCPVVDSVVNIHLSLWISIFNHFFLLRAQLWQCGHRIFYSFRSKLEGACCSLPGLWPAPHRSVPCLQKSALFVPILKIFQKFTRLITVAFHTLPPIFGSGWHCCGSCWCFLPIVQKGKGPCKELVASLDTES